jgi:hypothetical protein
MRLEGLQSIMKDGALAAELREAAQKEYIRSIGVQF